MTILLSPYNLYVTSIVSSYPNFRYLGKGSLNNYVDIILPFFYYLNEDIFYPEGPERGQNKELFDHLPSAYPPHLVHIVFEWPLSTKTFVLA